MKATPLHLAASAGHADAITLSASYGNTADGQSGWLASGGARGGGAYARGGDDADGQLGGACL